MSLFRIILYKKICIKECVHNVINAQIMNQTLQSPIRIAKLKQLGIRISTPFKQFSVELDDIHEKPLINYIIIPLPRAERNSFGILQYYLIFFYMETPSFYDRLFFP